MNAQTAFQKAVDVLRARGITSASLDAEVLLLHTLRQDRAKLYLHWHQELSTTQVERFFDLLERRAAHQPIAYLTGHQEFYGRDFLVTPATLIPRNETEILVEKAIQVIKNTTAPLQLIDLGTGSGCIPISIHKSLDTWHRQKIDFTLANDISPAALEVAKRNARRHQVKMCFVVGDLASAFPHLCRRKNLLITANLPYIPPERRERLPRTVKDFEPHQALFAAEKGLQEIKRTIQLFLTLKSPARRTLLLEMEPQQITFLQKALGKLSSEISIEVLQDLTQRKRVLVITKKPAK